MKFRAFISKTKTLFERKGKFNDKSSRKNLVATRHELLTMTKKKKVDCR